MSVLLKNGTFIDWKTLEFTRNINILVNPGASRLIFPDHSDIERLSADSEVIDCTGTYITKSFAAGHHHAYSALARGFSGNGHAPAGFRDILAGLWWKLDRCLDLEMVRYSALITAIDSALSGTTFVIDHHSSPTAVKGSLETIAAAFDETGVSHLLCYEVSCRDGRKVAEEGLTESSDYLSGHQGLIGLHASFTLDEEIMGQAADMMNRLSTGVHIHAAEDRSDQEDCIDKYGIRVIERLCDHGFLNTPKTILAHCIHINNEEREILRSSPCRIVQNTESNMNNNVGAFNSHRIENRSMLGTDGMHSDMIRSARFAYQAGKGIDNISCRDAYERARNVNRYLSENRFKGDGADNLVVFDYDPPTEFSQDNFPGHFINGMGRQNVRDVISKGKVIVRNRTLLTVNSSAIHEEARFLSEKLWQRMREC